MTAIDTANAEQRKNSDPRVSAFVAASAGSGKTKLLTDRLLRLMLAGTPPGKILCLTYTKAAAAEMTIRLSRRLGEWVVWPEARLADELRTLAVMPTPETLALARRIFGQVLDLPGGMRISTIHAFCQSLLRRFPLEAELSPHFELAEERVEILALREAREAVLAQPAARDAVAALAAASDEQSFAALTREFSSTAPDGLAGFNAAAMAALQRDVLGAAEMTVAQVLHDAVVWPDENILRLVLQRLAEAGNPSGRIWAEDTLGWLAKPPEDRAAGLDAWLAAFFTAAGQGHPRTLKGGFGNHLRQEEPAMRQAITRETERLDALREQLKAVRLAALNAELAKLILPILGREQANKQLNARLSYADLVTRTSRLLIDLGAAWVLYKLDGGIDHLLLDEVQDTAPAQWAIAHAIAVEFFAGSGARAQQRTIFAVGDPKQSIFSFQGADLRSFQKFRDGFAAEVGGAGATWVDGQLSVSFRSTAPVLALVDAVFAQGAARDGVSAPGDVLRHVVARKGQAGQVILWPLSRPSTPLPPPDWEVAADYQTAQSAAAALAHSIAEFVRARLGEVLPSRGRQARPGDFLILVRKRDALVQLITRALQARNIAVAGLDRMVLTEQPAVSDLLALCDALLLPDDDLAFAQFLASPLGGLSDSSLMELALYRRGSLAAALYARAAERQDWTDAKTYFEALRRRTDFLSPFALLSEALEVLGGRARLLRRLGVEAVEPMDELLAEALSYAQSEPGALQNFVHQLRQSGATIKREAEAGGDVLRIMTVHGAKGLQAPIVILPDTTSLPKTERKLFWLPAPQQPDLMVPVFCPRGALRPGAIVQAAASETQAAMAEYNRLLYVALTRAEDEVLICGAMAARALPQTDWYSLVQAGFSRLADVQTTAGGWLVHAAPQTAAPDRETAPFEATSPELPGWAGAAPDWVAMPPPRETTRPERLAPSRAAEDDTQRANAASPLGSAKADLRAARTAAMARGQVVHALLQHLPDLAVAQRRTAALRYLEQYEELAGQADDITTAVLRILEAPESGVLFGPGSRAEIPLAGVVGDVEIGGLVDRLVVTGAQVWIADYKTDRAPPAEATAIPEKYLRQLAAYKAILAQIYPHHEVLCLLVWTQNAALMAVPPEMLVSYAPA